MKKLMLCLVLTFSLLAFGNAYAQEWIWTPPVSLTSNFLKEIAADPITGDLYGIDKDGMLVMPILTGSEGTPGTPPAPVGSDDVVNDIAIASTGTIFICTEITIKSKGEDFMPLTQQPSPPANGKYTHITVGQGGKLYVLYQINGTETQYLMVGTPPVTSEGVLVEIHPETLNLGSKGRWVTGIIDLPGDADENMIMPETVKISRIEIPTLSIGEDVDIPVAPGAPWSVELLDGIRVLKVKFPRYDKADPANLRSLIGKLRELLATANADPGRYQVTLKVDMQLTSLQQFSGTDVIRIKLKHKVR